jgi:hypothetical protein
VTTTAERLEAARAKIETARQAVERDTGASPVLVAVVNEFAKKADKAAASDDESVAVIELEQAGEREGCSGGGLRTVAGNSGGRS